MNNFLQSLQQSWVRLLVHGAGVVLTLRAGWMISQAPTLSGWALFTDDVALRNIVLFTGKTGLLFLVLSLTCTPVARLLRWPTTLQVRKALGLWGFGFAVCHSLFFLRGKPLFTSLNPGPELWQALQDMMGIVRYGSKVPYAEAGVYALALLCLLAITSNRLAMRRLGKNWKRLHRLVYLAVPVAVYHYWWRTSTPFPEPPPPDSWQVFLFAMVVGILLMVRLPFVRRQLTKSVAEQKRQPLRPMTQPRLDHLPFPVSHQPRPPLHEPAMIGNPPPVINTNHTTDQEVQNQERVVEQA